MQEKTFAIETTKFKRKFKTLKKYAIRWISNEILRTINTPHSITLRLAPRNYTTKTIRYYKSKKITEQKTSHRKTFLCFFSTRTFWRVKVLIFCRIYIYPHDKETELFNNLRGKFQSIEKRWALNTFSNSWAKNVVEYANKLTIRCSKKSTKYKKAQFFMSKKRKAKSHILCKLQISKKCAIYWVGKIEGFACENTDNFYDLHLPARQNNTKKNKNLRKKIIIL